MPAIFDLLYREYCRARLEEMRQPLLGGPHPAVPEENCDVRDTDGSDSGPGDDGIAARYKAIRIH